ncbi:MAG: hypothetical protein WC668_00510 [Patescibacteria group bacterium]
MTTVLPKNKKSAKNATASFGQICAICKHQDQGGLHPDPNGSIRIKIKRAGQEFHLCEHCVRETINAERRRIYRQNHWALNELKRIKKHKNRPSSIKITTQQSTPRQPTDDELIDQIMERSPHRSRPIHPGAERFRRD